MKLYSYWRSTTSFRVRGALNLKGVEYQIVPVDLVAGAQKAPEYLALNPNGGVPALVLDDGAVLTQSLAIIDWLDAEFPEPRLIPVDARRRARVLAAAHTVAMDIHPVNNLKVVNEIKARFGVGAGAARDWMCHWMQAGFASLEAQLAEDTAFAFGDAPDIADLCIVAQAYNAHRWQLDLALYPKVTRVEAACLAVPAIAAAHPDRQPDRQEAT